MELTRFVALTLLLTSFAWSQEPSEPDVSVEFAKAGNLALVAIKNAKDKPDQLVKAAINDTEAAAFNDAEIYIVKQIKMLAFAYPIRFSDYTASVTIAMTTHSERDNAAADKAKIAVINTESCIAEWRIALRQRSAVTPPVCLWTPARGTH